MTVAVRTHGFNMQADTIATLDIDLGGYRARANRALEACLPQTEPGPAQLHEAMRYAVLNGGKRVRATLVYATANALAAIQGVDFEASLEELEGLVERMEEGELSLEESLKTYERGIALSRACQKSLDTAEQRIQILSEKDGAGETQDFQPDDD